MKKEQIISKIENILLNTLKISPKVIRSIDKNVPLNNAGLELDSIDKIGIIAGLKSEFRFDPAKINIKMSNVDSYSLNLLAELMERQG